MHTLPTLLVRDFTNPNRTFRISLRRARNYWELCEHLHSSFSKPWEQYAAHLHLDSATCGARISPSEWDAGGYFEEEFVNNGQLIVYVHFQELDRQRKERDERGIEEREWRWGWAEEIGLDRLDEKNTAEETLRVKNCPPFPESLDDELSDGTSLSIGELESPVLSPKILPRSPANKNTSLNGSSIALGDAAVCTKSTAWEASISATREKMTTKSKRQQPKSAAASAPKKKPGSPPSTSSGHPIPITPSTNHQTSLPEGVVIGIASSEHCRDPKRPPVVRATLNSSGALVAYIPGKHSVKPFASGRARVPLDSIVLSKEYDTGAKSFAKRMMFVKEKVKQQMKTMEASAQDRDVEEMLVDVESE